MHRDRILELRVLTGTHAGARVLLPDTSQRLGSGPDCDLVLSDEGLQPHHASIEARTDGTVLLRLHADPPSDLVLGPGEAVDLGPVRVAIEEADSPWREDLPIRNPAPEMAPEVNAAERGVGEGASSPARGGGTGADRTGLVKDLAALVTSAHPALVAVLVGIGLIASGAALMFSQGGPVTPDGEKVIPANPSASLANTSPPQGQTRPQLAAAIEPLGLGTKVRIEPDRNLGLRVKAAFLDTDQTKALKNALARLPSPPRLEIISQAQVLDQLQETLLNQATGPTGRLEVLALGQGKFRIQGRVASAPQRDELMAALTRAAPLAQDLESALRTDEDEAGALLQAMKDLGLADVRGEWTGGRLEAQVRIAPAALPRWERALAAVANQYPVPFRVTIIRLGSAPATALPFPLRSVVGGSMPFVTLGDGRRVAVDGLVDGWRLLAIRADAVVFESPDGSRVTQER